MLGNFHFSEHWLRTGEGERDEASPPESPTALDPVSEKIMQMLADMPEDKRRDVLKYAKEQKLLAEFLADKGAKERGVAAEFARRVAKHIQ